MEKGKRENVRKGQAAFANKYASYYQKPVTLLHLFETAMMNEAREDPGKEIVKNPGKDPGEKRREKGPNSAPTTPERKFKFKTKMEKTQQEDNKKVQVEVRNIFSDFKERTEYMAPDMVCRICPKTGKALFIAHIDEIIKIGEEIEKLQDMAHQAVTEIHKIYSLPPPQLDTYVARRRRHMGRVINSYYEIRRQLQEPGAQEKPGYNILLASLEVTGCLIMNPRLISYAEFRNDTHHYILRTQFFASPWTQSQIEYITWKPGEVGIEITKREQSVSYSFEIDNPQKIDKIKEIVNIKNAQNIKRDYHVKIEEVEEPGKDPTMEVEICQTQEEN